MLAIGGTPVELSIKKHQKMKNLSKLEILVQVYMLLLLTSKSRPPNSLKPPYSTTFGLAKLVENTQF